METIIDPANINVVDSICKFDQFNISAKTAK